jgi:hypothetical protein
MKSDFEVRIKRKNTIIRKLQKERVSHNSSNATAAVASNGQPNGAEAERQRVNLPR